MFPRPFPSFLLTLPLAMAAALSACTVGPDYAGAPPVAPDSIHASTFVRAPVAGVATTTGPAPSQWWRSFNDPQLNELVDAAFASNPDLQVAQAKLREARAQLQHQKANGMPTASADAAALRARQPDLGTANNPDLTGSGPLQLYTAGFDASWEIDLFGGTRRAVEAASDEASATDADLADAQVSLAAEVVQAYVDLRDEQQRLLLAQRSAELQRQMLVLTQQRRARGTAADVDVERLTTQVENTRATLTPLDAQVDESLDQLAVLTGQAPGALDQALSTARDLPAMPASVTVGDPTAMLQQRPDLRAAERRLASSNAQIGEQKANYFPKVTLLGDIGFSAGDPGHLVRNHNFSWIGVPYLQWNLLDFGRTSSGVHGAEASRDEADARYTHAVLAALQDANNALSRYGHQREHLATLQQVQASADRSAELMRQRYVAGASSLIDLLDTQRVQFSAQQDVVAGQAKLLKDFVSIQKSLGLGWEG